VKLFLGTTALVLVILAGLLTLARGNGSNGWIVYSSNHPDVGADLMLMTDDGQNHRRVTPDGVCAFDPHWSPNGQWIAYINACTRPQLLYRVRPGGGTPQVMSWEVNRTADVPWSPDGRKFLYTFGPNLIIWENFRQQNLLREHFSAGWSPDGEWVYAKPVLAGDDKLVRVHVETGEIDPIISYPSDVTNISWSPDGARFVVGVMDFVGASLTFMSPDGSDTESILLDLPTPIINYVVWSPDGEWIAFVQLDTGNSNIYRIRPDGSDLQRLNDAPSQYYTNLQWSPNSDWLLFQGRVGEQWQLFRMRADGSSIEQLTSGPYDNYEHDYAPIASREWHPLWVLVATAGLAIIATIFSRVSAQRNFIAEDFRHS